MLILSRIRAKQPGRGFASTFVSQMDDVMGTCLDRGIKVVSNAGGLDPAGCAEAVQEVADRLGLSPTIAYVDGDDLLPRIAELAAADALQPFAEGGELGDLGRYLTANAYLGCWGIVEALAARCRHRDHRPCHRRRRHVRSGGVASRLGTRRLGPAGGRGGRRSRDRVQRPGHRWQLLVLHRGARHGAARFPVGRGRRRRLDRDRQARRHRRPGLGRHGHVAAAVRDRRARVISGPM